MSHEEERDNYAAEKKALSGGAKLGKRLYDRNHGDGDFAKNKMQDAGKKMVMKAAEATGKAAIQEAAAAATGPAGEAVKYAAKIIKKVADTTEDVANAGRGTKKKHNGLLMFFAAFFIIINMFSYDQAKTLVSPVVSNYSASLFGQFSDEIFLQAAEANVEQLRNDGHVILAETAEIALQIYKGFMGFRSKVTSMFESLRSGSLEGEDDGAETIGVATDIDMNKYFESSSSADIEVIQKLGFQRGIDDAKRAAYKYIALYDEMEIDRDISNAIVDLITWEDVYYDTNYAEFLSILNENEEFSANKTSLRKFKKLFNTRKKRKNLWRIRFELVEEEIEKEIFDDDGNYLRTEKEIIHYLNTIVRPYTLKMLYDFVGVDAEETHYLYKNTSNIDVLDRSESAIRTFMPYYDFGTTFRTPWEDDFEETDISEYFDTLIDTTIFYQPSMTTEETWSILEQLLEGKDISEAQRAVIEAALATIGSAYNQDYRDDVGIYDCSSLVARVYAAAGYKIADYSPTAAEECRIMESWGTRVTDKSDLQPGDILFFSYKSEGKYNGRYKNVSHVAIYIGNGMQIDARGKKYGVVYRQSQENSAACTSICRPLSHLVN